MLKCRKILALVVLLSLVQMIHGNGLNDAWKKVEDFFKRVKDWAAGKASNATASVRNYVMSRATGFASHLAEEAAEAAFKEVGKEAKDFVEGTEENIKGTMDSLGKEATNFAENTGESIKNALGL